MIRDALLALMKKYPYEDISITQICREAQVVRQTYYRNFESKGDILAFHPDQLLERYHADYYKEEDVQEQLKGFFSYMLVNREFLKLALANNLFFMIDRLIAGNIAKFVNTEELSTIEDPHSGRYVIRFIASTVCSLLALWVENDFQEAPEWIAQLAQRFLSGQK